MIDKERLDHFFSVMDSMKADDGIPFEEEVRWHLTQALGKMMSGISEETYFAGWLDRLEEKLPYALPPIAERGYDTSRDEWIVDQKTAKTMCTIAEALGHWAFIDFGGGDPYYLPYRPDPNSGLGLG